MKWLFMLGIGMGACVLGFSAFEAFDQHRFITAAQSVDAIVESAYVKSTYSQYMSSYEPIVVFRYTVGGQSYESESATPNGESYGGTWAQSVVAQFKVGETYPAWYAPDQPERAFLLKRYDSSPYMGVLIGIIMTLMFAALLPWAMRRGAKMFAPTDHGDGWFELRAPLQLRGAVRLFLGGGIVWQVVGAPVWGHYLVVGEPPRGGFFWGATGAYVVIGTVLIGLGFWAWWVGRSVGDARVFIDHPTPATGDRLQVLVQQEARRDLRIKDLVVTLVCKQRTINVLAPNPVMEEKIVNEERHALTDAELSAGEWVSEVFDYLIPPFAPPSTSNKQRGKTRSEWSIAMKLSLRGAPPYPDNFTIRVAEGDRINVPVGTARPVGDGPAA